MDIGIVDRIRERLNLELPKIGISFGRWNLAVDQKYVRRRVRIRGWMWTPFYTYIPRTKGVRVNFLNSETEPPVLKFEKAPTDDG